MKNLTAWMRLLQFLMGLNQEFDIIRSQILSLDPLPKASKALLMLVLSLLSLLHLNLISSNPLLRNVITQKNLTNIVIIVVLGDTLRTHASKSMDTLTGIRNLKNLRKMGMSKRL